MRRTNARLLRTVNGQPHATDADHHPDALPTPPASNEQKNAQGEEEMEADIYRDPESSGDEGAQALPTAQSNGSTFQRPPQFDRTTKSPAAAPPFRRPAKPASPESKRGSKRGSEEASSESDDMIFGSSQASRPSPGKKARTTNSLGNIHAPPAPQRRTTYGSRKKKILIPTRKGFQPPRTSADTEKQAEKPRATFKTPKGFDPDAVARHRNDATLKALGGAGDMEDGGSSPSLTELSSADSDIEEIDVSALGLPAPEPYVPTASCAICGVSVPLLLKQEFEDQYTGGKALSYKWQERFCRYHKVDTARSLWTERGYPDIDWMKLEDRLRRHHEHLEAILANSTPSYYRDKLQERVNSGRMKSTRSVLSKGDADKDREGGVGYYGPRGERVMTDHIISHFGDAIRVHATNDPLLKTSGVAGGVSGFVQAVLVPELALKLVEEDMKVGVERAQEILHESADVGEFVNDEARHKRKEVDTEVEEIEA